MKIIEGKLYFIKDEFIEKYNPKYHLMENKESGTKRPTYFCFRDKTDKDILWFVPMSSKYAKYLKIYNEIKSKRKIEPNNFVFARNLAGKKAVFLIQNMFPTLEKYIKQEYKKAGISIKVPKAVKEEIDKKTRDVFALTNRGIIATFSNLPEFLNDIKTEKKCENIYSENPSIFQKYVALTTQKQILVEKIYNNIINNNNQKQINLLDIGCGDGIVTIPVIKKLSKLYNVRTTVIESSNVLLKNLESNLTNNDTIINTNVENIDKLPNSDFILMVHIATYIKDLKKFLNKVIDSLNCNGTALIVVTNRNSDDIKVKNNSNQKSTTSEIIQDWLTKKKVTFTTEVVESVIDVSGIDKMDDDGKTIIAFFKHKKFEEIDSKEIEDMKNNIFKLEDENKNLIKREDYIWIKK